MIKRLHIPALYIIIGILATVGYQHYLTLNKYRQEFEDLKYNVEQAERTAQQSGYYSQACLTETKILESKLRDLKVQGTVEVIINEGR